MEFQIATKYGFQIGYFRWKIEYVENLSDTTLTANITLSPRKKYANVWSVSSQIGNVTWVLSFRFNYYQTENLTK